MSVNCAAQDTTQLVYFVCFVFLLAGLGIEPSVLHLRNKSSITELPLQLFLLFVLF